MKIDVAELKRLAQKATPGPWAYDADEGVVFGPGDAPIADARGYGTGLPGWKLRARIDANGGLIAAANPQAILALIERLETLEAERKGTVRLTLEQAKSLELAGTEDSSYGEKCWCPACGTGVPYEYDGDRWFIRPQPIPHREDCWLAAAIKDATKSAPPMPRPTRRRTSEPEKVH